MKTAIPVFGLILLAFGGYLNGIEAVNKLMPVNLILVGAIITAVYIAAVIPMRGTDVKPLILLGALALATAPGFIFGYNASEYGGEKIAQLLTLVPLTVIGGSLILQSRSRRVSLLSWTVVYAAIGTVLAVLFPSESYLDANQWFAEGSNYIAASRSSIGGMLVLAVAALYGKKYRVYSAAGSIAFFGAALLTGARGPLFAGLAALVVLVVIRGSIRVAFPTLIGASALYAAYLWLGSQGILSERLSNLDDNSTEVRGELFQVTASSIADSWYGVGWGGLAEVFDTSGRVAPGLYTYPHNVYIEMFAEAGWVAGLAFVAILIVAFRRQLATFSDPVENAILVLFIFYALSAAVSGDLLSEKGLWLMLGACLCGVSTHEFKSPMLHGELMEVSTHNRGQ